MGRRLGGDTFALAFLVTLHDCLADGCGACKVDGGSARVGVTVAIRYVRTSDERYFIRHYMAGKTQIMCYRAYS
jgi:hypothetical protein